MIPPMNIKNKENTNIENHLFNLLNNKKIRPVTANQENVNNNNNTNVPNSNSNGFKMSSNQQNSNNSQQMQQMQMQMQMNNQSTIIGTNPNSTATNFINSYSSFTKRDSVVSQNSNNGKSQMSQAELSEEEMQKLSDRHQKLINKILIEEESYIENHRKHVDEMVEIMKEVTKIIFLKKS
jgi:hypothetical protein